MATKEAVFSLRVDTGNSVQDIQNADIAVKNLNKDLKDTQATTSGGTGVNKFATDLAALDAKIKTGGLSMREMTKAIKDYQTIAIQAGVTSPIGKQAMANAATLTDQIGDIRARTTLLASDTVKLDTAMAGLQTGVGIFQGIQGAAALAGIENEDLQKTMVKLQAVQGVSNALNIVAKNLNKDAILGIQVRIGLEKIRNFILNGTNAAQKASIASEVGRGAAMAGATTATIASTMAMKAFRIALITTGIGALIVGVGLLIGNFDSISKGILKARDEFEKFGLGAKIAIGIITLAIFPLGAIIYGVVKALEYFGAVDDATTRKNKANAEARTKAIVKEANNAAKLAKQKQTSDDNKYTHEINLAKASGKATYEMELLKAKSHLASGRVFLTAQNVKIKAFQAELEMLIATGDADSDRVKQLKKSLIDSKKIATDTFKDNLATKQAIEVMEAQHKKELSDKAKANAKQSIQRENELNKSRLEVLKARIERENAAIEESEKIKFEKMSEGSEKQIEILKDTFGDFRTQIIRKANEKQIQELDKNFEKGKMTEIEYRNSLEKIMTDGVKNLTESEIQLMSDKQTQLDEAIRRAKLTAQQREIENVEFLFKDRIALAESQGEQGKQQLLKLTSEQEIEKLKNNKEFFFLV